MKALYISSSILLSIIAVACSHKSSDTSNESTISNFQIVQTVKSATRNYICKGANAVFADSLPIYSKVHLTIQWPEELGGFNIQPLQDSIMTAIYETPKTSIDETILAALDSPFPIVNSPPRTLSPLKKPCGCLRFRCFCIKTTSFWFFGAVGVVVLRLP